MIWIVLILGTVVGAFAGGRASLRLARDGDLAEARRRLRGAAWIAAVSGVAFTIPTLGWPFKDVADSVPEEISRIVVQTVEVPVQATRWLFFKTTRMESREVTREVKETAYRTETKRQFSFWLLLPMAAVGWLCYLLEKGFVFLLWRWFG